MTVKLERTFYRLFKHLLFPFAAAVYLVTTPFSSFLPFSSFFLFSFSLFFLPFSLFFILFFLLLSFHTQPQTDGKQLKQRRKRKSGNLSSAEFQFKCCFFFSSFPFLSFSLSFSFFLHLSSLTIDFFQ